MNPSPRRPALNIAPPRHVQILMRPLPLAAVLLCGFLSLACAGVLEELSPADRERLANGESVLVTREVDGAVWPEISIYRTVKSSPEGVTDLFLDYENASTFVENLVEAKVESQPSPNAKDVRYTVKLPVIFTISYLVRNEYEKTATGFTVRWKLLESLLAKSAVGSLRVEPHPAGAIICYRNHVEPATRLVAGLRGHAMKEASKTVEAIAREAERRHRAAAGTGG